MAPPPPAPPALPTQQPPPTSTSMSSSSSSSTPPVVVSSYAALANEPPPMRKLSSMVKTTIASNNDDREDGEEILPTTTSGGLPPQQSYYQQHDSYHGGRGGLGPPPSSRGGGFTGREGRGGPPRGGGPGRSYYNEEAGTGNRDYEEDGAPPFHRSMGGRGRGGGERGGGRDGRVLLRGDGREGRRRDFRGGGGRGMMDYEFDREARGPRGVDRGGPGRGRGGPRGGGREFSSFDSRGSGGLGPPRWNDRENDDFVGRPDPLGRRSATTTSIVPPPTGPPSMRSMEWERSSLPDDASDDNMSRGSSGGGRFPGFQGLPRGGGGRGGRGVGRSTGRGPPPDSGGFPGRGGRGFAGPVSSTMGWNRDDAGVGSVGRSISTSGRLERGMERDFNGRSSPMYDDEGSYIAGGTMDGRYPDNPKRGMPWNSSGPPPPGSVMDVDGKRPRRNEDEPAPFLGPPGGPPPFQRGEEPSSMMGMYRHRSSSTSPPNLFVGGGGRSDAQLPPPRLRNDFERNQSREQSQIIDREHLPPQAPMQFHKDDPIPSREPQPSLPIRNYEHFEEGEEYPEEPHRGGFGGGAVPPPQQQPKEQYQLHEETGFAQQRLPPPPASERRPSWSSSSGRGGRGPVGRGTRGEGGPNSAGRFQGGDDIPRREEDGTPWRRESGSFPPPDENGPILGRGGGGRGRGRGGPAGSLGPVGAGRSDRHMSWEGGRGRGRDAGSIGGRHGPPGRSRGGEQYGSSRWMDDQDYGTLPDRPGGAFRPTEDHYSGPSRDTDVRPPYNREFRSDFSRMDVPSEQRVGTTGPPPPRDVHTADSSEPLRFDQSRPPQGPPFQTHAPQFDEQLHHQSSVHPGPQRPWSQGRSPLHLPPGGGPLQLPPLPQGSPRDAPQASPRGRWNQSQFPMDAHPPQASPVPPSHVLPPPPQTRPPSDGTNSIQRMSLPSSKASVEQEVESETELEIVGPTLAPTPEPKDPTQSVLATTRLMDLEAQMEYAFAKHMQLILEQQKLKVRYQHLQGLGVGLEAIQADLDKLLESNSRSEEAPVPLESS